MHKKLILETKDYLKNKGWHMTGLMLATLLTEPVENIKALFHYPFGLLNRFDYHNLNPQLADTHTKRSPILLLHGNYHNQSAWIDLAKHLNDNDMGPIYTVNLRSGQYHNEDKHIIKSKIESIKKQYKSLGNTNFKIDLIGHSRGAVMAFYSAFKHNQWYIDEYGKFVLRVKQLIKRNDIGKIIRIGHPTTQQERSIIQQTNDVYDIVAKHDVLVNDQSTLDRHHQRIINSGHLGLLYSNKVHSIVQRWLKGERGQV